MIVVCTSNSLESLSNKNDKRAYSENIFQDEVWLEIGKEYEVFGVSFRDGLSVPWYLVCEEDDSEYPKPHLGAFFKIIDGSIPNFWQFCFESNNLGDCGFLPQGWAKDCSFMEKLIDKDADAVSYFESLKSQKSGQ